MSLTVDQHFALQSVRLGHRAAVVPLVQDVAWMKKAPYHLRLELLQDPELLKVALPHLPMNMFTNLIWKLSDDAKRLVVEQFPRAAVFEKLARERDLPEDLFDILVQKGRRKVLLEFWTTVLHSRTYSPSQQLSLYLRLIQDFNVVETPPASWGPPELAAALQAATARLAEVDGHLPALWAAAEVAGIVDPTVRKYWHHRTGAAYGPIDVVAYELNDSVAITYIHDPQFSRARPLKAFQRWGDTSGLLQSGEVIPAVDGVARLAHSPHAEELLSQCTDAALARAAMDGVPVQTVLPHVKDPHEFIDELSGFGWRVQLPLEMLWKGRPAVAYRMTSGHANDRSTQLTAQVSERMGDSPDAWRFFWESFGAWSGSLEELVETSRAVGQ